MNCLLSILAAVGLLVPIQFSDLKFSCEDKDFSRLVADAADYFNAEFGEPGRFSHTVAPVCTIDKGYAYFGANSPSVKDVNFYEAAIQACRELDGTVDFSGIDYLSFIVPGPDEADGADELLFRSKCSKFSEAQVSLILDGKNFNDYLLVTETGIDGMFTGHGNLCHEFCHLLGLKDFYDTDGPLSGGYSEGFWGELSLMDTGNRRGNGHNPPHLCAAEREDLGIKGGEPLTVGNFILEPLEKNGRYLRFDTDRHGETWFLECREGGDLMLSRIDKSESEAGASDYFRRTLTAAERWQFNEINCRPGCECASGTFCPAGGMTLSIDTLALTSVSRSAEGISFKIIEPLKNMDVTPLQDAVIASWETGIPPDEISGIRIFCSAAGREVASKTLARSEGGGYFCIVDGLTPKTGYCLTIEIRAKDGYVVSRNRDFSTKALRGDSIPFIYLGRSGRNEDGSFRKGVPIPLRVVNATDAIRISWTFDAAAIVPDENGMFTPTRDGELRAQITFDGSSLTICKKINLR